MRRKRRDDLRLLVLVKVVVGCADLDGAVSVLLEETVDIGIGEAGEVETNVLLGELEELEPVDDVLLAYDGTDHALVGVAVKNFAFDKVVGLGGEAKYATIFSLDV